MGDKLHFFQLGVLMVFGVLAVIGMVVISTHKNSGGSQTIRIPIVIWGPPLGENVMKNVLDGLKRDNESFEKVSYVEKNPVTLYSDLLEAIATGNGPDLVILNSSGLLPLRNKLYPISFDTVPLSTFRSAFIEGSEIFVLSDATYALPLLVDPLVLFWNRDIYAAAGIAEVPKDWVTFSLLVPRLSKLVRGSDLVQSGVAFGEYDNVMHAKEILSALFMQTGATIVHQAGVDNAFMTDLGLANAESKSSLALSFYTSFSNPLRTVYSWNKTFDRSREAFAANKVAMYAGFVSEEPILYQINPNLNFDVALWPQLEGSHFSLTYGKFYGVGVLKSSQNTDQALFVAQTLASSLVASKLSELTGLPSARRDVLSKLDTSDPFSNTKAQSALMARSWLEPAPQSEVNSIFARAINNVVSGITAAEMGTGQAAAELEVLLDQYNK